MTDSSTQRQSDRFLLLTGGQPFLGFSADWKTHFLYLPKDVSAGGAGFESARTGQFLPAKGERLNLCLPFQTNDTFFDQCEVSWVRGDLEHWECGGRFCHRTPLRYPFFLEARNGIPHFARGNWDDIRAAEKIAELLHEAVYTKKAILIYFRHLIPFFSRLSRHSSRGHSAIEFHLLRQIEASIESNISTLQELERSISEESAARLCRDRLFLRAFRNAILSEISSDALGCFFDAPAVPRYIRSIRISEHKLALNYNAVIVIQHWMG
jgi:hypothetical protein